MTARYVRRHFLAALVGTAGLVLVCLTACASEAANLLYNFERWNDGELVATLELSSLPATHAEVVGLSFSPAALARLAAPPIYPEFDETVHSFVSDGSGGLMSSSISENAVIGDTDGYSVDTTKYYVSLQATPSGFDVLLVIAFYGRDGVLFPFDGNWRLVPEPATHALLMIGILIGTMSRRRRGQRS